MTALDVVPAGPAPVTAADLLLEAARIQAAKDVLTAYDADIRRLLRAECDRLEAETGVKATLKAKGVAAAYVSEPSMRPHVTDQAALDDHARAKGVGQDRLCVDCAALQGDVDTGLPADVLAVLAPYLAVERIMPAGWLDGYPDLDGQLVDPDTGELLPVVLEPASRPTLTVRVDSGFRKRTAAELSRRLPELAP